MCFQMFTTQEKKNINKKLRRIRIRFSCSLRSLPWFMCFCIVQYNIMNMISASCAGKKSTLESVSSGYLTFCFVTWFMNPFFSLSFSLSLSPTLSLSLYRFYLAIYSFAQLMISSILSSIGGYYWPIFR